MFTKAYISKSCWIGLIGGNIGLFTGLSFLSFVDVVVFIYSFFKSEDEPYENNAGNTDVEAIDDDTTIQVATETIESRISTLEKVCKLCKLL